MTRIDQNPPTVAPLADACSPRHRAGTKGRGVRFAALIAAVVAAPIALVVGIASAEDPTPPATPAGVEAPAKPATPAGLDTPAVPTTPAGPEAPAAPATPAGLDAPDILTTPKPPNPVLRAGRGSEDVTLDGSSSATMFAAGRTVTVTSSAPDVVVAGETVVARGVVRDNLVAAGRSVTVRGPVGGDALLAGEELRLEVDVLGDVYAMGDTLVVPRGVTVGGNVYFLGERLNLEGTIGGGLQAAAASVALNGAVGGDVAAQVADLRLGGDASVGGALSYTSSAQAEIAPTAKVGGATTWSQPEREGDDDDGDDDDDDGVLASLGTRLFFFGAALLAGGALLLLFPRALTRPAAVLGEATVESLGVGAAVLLGVPLLALALMLFVLPIPLSLTALAMFVPATYVARLVAAVALGALVVRRLGREARPFGALAAGLAILNVLYLVPYVGGLLVLAGTVLGLGAMFLAARGGTADAPAVA